MPSLRIGVAERLIGERRGNAPTARHPAGRFSTSWAASSTSSHHPGSGAGSGGSWRRPGRRTSATASPWPRGRCSWRRRRAPRSSSRWRRSSSGCRGWCSACGPGRSPTGSTVGCSSWSPTCCARSSSGGAVPGHRDRPDRRGRRARHDVPPRRGRGLRRHRERPPAADARRARGPRHRQRTPPGGVPHRQPARRTAARGVPLRRRRRVAVPRAGAVRRARGAARVEGGDASRCRSRPRGHPRAARHRRRDALDPAPPAGADAGARHPRRQHHVGRGVVSARALLPRPTRHGRGRRRAARDGRGGRWARQHERLRHDRAPGRAGDHHARLPAARGAHPPRPGPHDDGVGGHRHHGGLRRLRVRVGHRLAGRAPALGAAGVPGPGRERVRRRALPRARHRAGRPWAGSSPSSGGSRRRSGSRSWGRGSRSSSCGGRSGTSPTRTSTDRHNLRT